jgi:hypothetical protein
MDANQGHQIPGGTKLRNDLKDTVVLIPADRGRAGKILGLIGTNPPPGATPPPPEKLNSAASFQPAPV